jgi:hypothetical protein
LLPDGEAGDRPLIEALRARNVAVRIASWSDPDVDWASFDLTVIRSTWDYTSRRADFLDWVGRVPRLQNPARVVRANSDKVYLRDLAAAGLPVVPTSFSDPGEPVPLPASGEFVVKPSVGAGSRGAGRFDADRPGERDRAAEHAAQLHRAGRTVLVQPYLSGVDTDGETALIFLGGRFSHSIRKGRMLAEGIAYDADAPSLYIEENISDRVPSQQELEVAERFVEHFAGMAAAESGEPLLYARIDLLPSADGPQLVEAELTEPSLFLDRSPQAAQVLAGLIVQRATAGA